MQFDIHLKTPFPRIINLSLSQKDYSPRLTIAMGHTGQCPMQLTGSANCMPVIGEKATSHYNELQGAGLWKRLYLLLHTYMYD